jgi:hypothetical protein
MVEWAPWGVEWYWIGWNREGIAADLKKCQSGITMCALFISDGMEYM